MERTLCIVEAREMAVIKEFLETRVLVAVFNYPASMQCVYCKSATSLGLAQEGDLNHEVDCAYVEAVGAVRRAVRAER